MGEREIVVASHLGKTVGWGRSLKWANWVLVNIFVSRWLDSGFEGPPSLDHLVDPRPHVLRDVGEKVRYVFLRINKEFIFIKYS